jgi:fermentation-respiration switch protein FrsA (DUF1100 family)
LKRTLLLLLVLAAGGGWLIAGAGHDLRRAYVTSAGVPLDEVHPSASGPHPGVVVAHGFSGSAKLMAPFGDTLAARGYRNAGQCSGLQAGGEGPRWEGRQARAVR